MTTVTSPVTADQFDALAAEMECKAELIAGEVVIVPGPSLGHGLVASIIVTDLRNFVAAREIGEVFTSAAFQVRRDPDWVPVPDVAFVRSTRLSLVNQRGTRLDGAPDLAVEVQSPSNADARSMEKLQAYFEAGATRVWMVYPALRIVTVWRSGTEGRLAALTYGPADVLGSDEAGFELEGFALPLAPVFSAYARLSGGG